jgi:hypothetical protein
MKRKVSFSTSAGCMAIFVLAVAAAHAAAGRCLTLDSLGPIQSGMTVEQVLNLADFSGMERKQPADQCWYLRYGQAGKQGPAFQLMIIDGRVVRIEITGASTLQTLSGAHIGSAEEELKQLYGARLDVQPQKYDEKGHTLTYRSTDGGYGLRFETSSGKVTAIQAGPWEHLNYVEGCS